MANYVWDDLVVGGTGVPRIIVPSENKVTYPRIEDSDLDDWIVNNLNINLSQTEDEDAYKRYMLKASWSPSLYSYFALKVDIGQSVKLGTRKYLFSCRIKDASISDGATIPVRISYVINNVEYDFREIILTNKIKRVAFVFEGDIQNASGTEIYIRFYTGIGFRTNGQIMVDDLHLCIVEQDYQFKCPNESYLSYERDSFGNALMNDGKIQEYNKFWKPNYYGFWQIMEKKYEKFRIKISEAGRLFVFPHTDFYWGFFGVWDDGIQMKYPFNRYIGHESEILIKASEFLVGDIHPLEVEYVPPPTYYDVVIGSSFPNSGVYVTLSPEDKDGFSSGNTQFTRTYEEDTEVEITAPAQTVYADLIADFYRWVDGDGLVISLERSFTATIDEDKEYIAEFQYPETPVSGGGYGEAPYGGSGTVGYGDVF